MPLHSSTITPTRTISILLLFLLLLGFTSKGIMALSSCIIYGTHGDLIFATTFRKLPYMKKSNVPGWIDSTSMSGTWLKANVLALKANLCQCADMT
jgi:hypothetical protein